MAQNITYINQKDIVKIDAFGEKKIGKVYKKEFPQKKFLWWILREKEERYVVSLDSSYDNSYSTIKECLSHLHGWAGDRYVYGDNAEKTYYDPSSQTLYLKCYAKIKLNNGNEYNHFFSSKNEMENYVNAFSITNNLTPLRYTDRD